MRESTHRLGARLFRENHFPGILLNDGADQFVLLFERFVHDERLFARKPCGATVLVDDRI
ncbi:hypothetical protein ACF3MZ_06490 [Paenibacillaceae bacterium WGS1546]|uniref:hypothetical protein n=1 Tax=Cohnella sp. WGS1546 TaxID=3366810 RepID=UPI00372D48CD